MKNKPALECSSFKAAELSQTQEFNMLFRDDNDWINFAKVRFPNQKNSWHHFYQIVVTLWIFNTLAPSKGIARIWDQISVFKNNPTFLFFLSAQMQEIEANRK